MTMRFIRSIPAAIVLVFVALFAFTATGFAAETATPADSSSLLDLLQPVYNAFSGGHYAYAGALLVILMVALAKRYLGDKWSWLHTDAGGATLALLASGSAALASALAAPGTALTLSLFKSALLVGVGAAGGYAMIKSLIIEPLLKPLAAKLPAWTQPIFAVVFWVFDKSESAQAAELAKADAAGAAAVAAAGNAGLSSVIGKPTDVS